MTMVNNVIEVLNYVIAAHPLLLNNVIADNHVNLAVPVSLLPAEVTSHLR
jgi:hypothetical protein